MTTFKPGDVVERVAGEDFNGMARGSRHTVSHYDDGSVAFEGDTRWWAAENFQLATWPMPRVATVGKLRLFPASTALARGR